MSDSAAMNGIITIGDEPFRISYMEYDTERYEEFLEKKIEIALKKLPHFITSQIQHIEIIRSPKKHFRQRCRFAIMTLPDTSNELPACSTVSHSLDKISGDDSPSDILANENESKNEATRAEAVIETDTATTAEIEIDTELQTESSTLSYCLWENGGPNIIVKTFPIASIQIYNTMPIILEYIQNVPELKFDLRAINFLSTMSGELIATLIYENQIDSNWEMKAIAMQSHLGRSLLILF